MHIYNKKIYLEFVMNTCPSRKKKKNTIGKWAKYLNRHFTEMTKCP